MTHSARSKALGAYGERLAEQFLRDAGLQVLDRNWRCSQGEIDIVARDGECLVVCEVKTRASTAFGSPIEQITAVKAARLRRLAGAWVAEHPELAALSPLTRIDVIGVAIRRYGPAAIEHLAGVA